MKNIIGISGPSPVADDWRGPVFDDGRIVVFSGFPALDALVELGRSLCREAYRDDRPDQFSNLSDQPDFVIRADDLDRRFHRAPDTTMLFNAFFRAVGLAPERLYYDRWRLRTNPSHRRFLSDKTRHVPPHRDNWGSHIHCQLNWWAPLFEIEAQQALVFYPDYWDSPIANDSESWNLEALKQHRQRGEDYPTLPTATTVLPVDAARPLMIRPGEIACFSGAHLHGSADNRSGRCRFNMETRTVSLDDLDRNRIAVNVDGPRDRAPAGHWFRHCLDGGRLSELES